MWIRLKRSRDAQSSAAQPPERRAQDVAADAITEARARISHEMSTAEATPLPQTPPTSRSGSPEPTAAPLFAPAAAGAGRGDPRGKQPPPAPPNPRIPQHSGNMMKPQSGCLFLQSDADYYSSVYPHGTGRDDVVLPGTRAKATPPVVTELLAREEADRQRAASSTIQIIERCVADGGSQRH